MKRIRRLLIGITEDLEMIQGRLYNTLELFVCVLFGSVVSERRLGFNNDK